jgi:hypothetical protein
MSRRIGIVALVVMALIAVAAVEADAHWTIVSGKLVYHSLDCQSIIKDWDPSLEGVGVCNTTATTTELRCYNPSGFYNDQGTSFNPIVFPPVEGSVEPDKVTKKGKSSQAAGHLTATVLENADVPSLGLSWDEAGCPNSNWTVRAILRQAILVVDVYQCVVAGSGCSPLDTNTTDETKTYTATYTCTLPAEFTFDNPPTAGTDMTCTTVSSTHVE